MSLKTCSLSFLMKFKVEKDINVKPDIPPVRYTFNTRVLFRFPTLVGQT